MWLADFLGNWRVAAAAQARVAELADAVDSKSTDESLVGSTPTPGTSGFWLMGDFEIIFARPLDFLPASAV